MSYELASTKIVLQINFFTKVNDKSKQPVFKFVSTVTPNIVNPTIIF